MDRTEFMQELQESLLGEVPNEVIQESLDYYAEYIGQQLADGVQESQVMDSLGSGRLIAKSIIDANNEKESHQHPYYAEEVTYDEDFERIDPAKQQSKSDFAHKTKIAAVILAIILVIGCVLGLVLKLFTQPWFYMIVAAIALYTIWKRDH